MIIALWRRRLLEVHNYYRFRLDLITALEIVVAAAIVLYFSLSALFDQSRQFEKMDFLSIGWRTFLVINFWALILTFLSGICYAVRTWLPNRLSALLSLPIPDRQLATYHLGELSLPILIFFPFWIIWNGGVLFEHMNVVHATMILFLNMFLYASLFMLGLIITQLWQGRSLFRLISFLRMTGVVLAQGIMLYSLWRLPLSASWMLVIMQLCLMVVFARIWIAGFQLILRQNPALLVPQPRQSQKKRQGLQLETWFVWPVPRSLRSLVVKDLRYALRCYRAYPILIMLFFIIMVIALLRAGNGRDALQWQLSLSIALAYLLANAAFRFNAQEAENWALLKSLPLRTHHFWWSKFYVVFLPLLWFIGFGHLIILLRYQAAWGIFALNLLASLAIAFTLAFIQTNFSLYTFPFARYASLWYNLYIWTAILFFTILLFPPLAIAFLFYGFYAIRRVLKRFDNWVQA